MEEVALTTNKIRWVCQGTSWTRQAGMRFGLLKEHVGGRQIHENEEWKWLFVNGYTCYAVALTVMHQDLNGYSPPSHMTFFLVDI